MAKYCSRCGASNKDAAVFCNNCSARLSETTPDRAPIPRWFETIRPPETLASPPPDAPASAAAPELPSAPPLIEETRALESLMAVDEETFESAPAAPAEKPAEPPSVEERLELAAELPEWLRELPQAEQFLAPEGGLPSAVEEPAAGAPAQTVSPLGETEAEPPAWLAELQAAQAEWAALQAATLNQPAEAQAPAQSAAADTDRAGAPEAAARMPGPPVEAAAGENRGQVSFTEPTPRAPRSASRRLQTLLDERRGASPEPPPAEPEPRPEDRIVIARPIQRSRRRDTTVPTEAAIPAGATTMAAAAETPDAAQPLVGVPPEAASPTGVVAGAAAKETEDAVQPPAGVAPEEVVPADSGARDAATEIPAEPAPEVSAEPPRTLPDWLKDLGPGALSAADLSAEASSEDLLNAALETRAQLEQEGALPPAETGPAFSEPAPVEPLFQETPPWLVEIQETPAEAPVDSISPASAPPVWADETPDFLIPETPAAEPAAEAAAALPQGELPEWIEALRPSELAGPLPPAPTPVEEVPSTGLLAGLKGVLPVAAAVSQAHTLAPLAPPALEGEGLFANVLATPVELAQGLRPERAERVSAPTRLRLFLNLLLLSVVVGAFFLPSGVAGLGLGVTQAPSAEMFNVVQEVPSGSLVLLAFDYTAGETAELEPAARLLLQAFLQRGVRVLALSTHPAGPGLAQALFQEARRDRPEWAYGSNFVNLGYVLGGEAGLRSLADAGLGAVTADWQGAPLRELPATASLRGWGDAALVVEVAGSADTLRAWVEQVQARQGVRLAAAVSAAAEPQARAYRSTRQLTAMMRGLVGAAEFELLSNRPGRATATLDALSLAHLLMAAVIVLGNLVYWAGRLGARRMAR